MYDAALQATVDLIGVQHWITHAKFHATNDDRGYPTGGFDWQRFHDALADPKFRPCCAMVHVVAFARVRDLLGVDWWDCYRDAMLAYVETYLEPALEAAA